MIRVEQITADLAGGELVNVAKFFPSQCLEQLCRGGSFLVDSLILFHNAIKTYTCKQLKRVADGSPPVLKTGIGRGRRSSLHRRIEYTAYTQNALSIVCSEGNRVLMHEWAVFRVGPFGVEIDADRARSDVTAGI